MPCTDAQKAAKKQPLLDFWKLVCITNSPHKDPNHASRIRTAFGASLSPGALKRLHSKEQRFRKNYMKYEPEEKNSMLVFFIKLALAIDLEKHEVESAVYAGNSPSLDRKWGKYEKPTDSEYTSEA